MTFLLTKLTNFFNNFEIKTLVWVLAVSIQNNFIFIICDLTTTF